MFHGKAHISQATRLLNQKAVDLDSLRVSENRVMRRISGSNSQERDGEEKILHRHYEYNGQIKEMGVKKEDRRAASF